MVIRIKNLHLRAIIGLNDWEREKAQDIMVNLEFEIDGDRAAETDDIKDSVDYKRIKYKIVDSVEKTEFFLLERLAGFILELVMEEKKVKKATVEIDKPHALRFAESVSIQLTRERKD